MKIDEFARTKCQDLYERLAKQQELDMFATYPCDEVIYDDLGSPVKVVNTRSHQIPIADILGMPRDEFATVYADEEALDAYDKYMSMFIYMEGAEAVHYIRNAMAAEMKKLNDFVVPGTGVDI